MSVRIQGEVTCTFANTSATNLIAARVAQVPWCYNIQTTNVDLLWIHTHEIRFDFDSART